MEVVQIRNDHLYKEGGEKEYGCECKNCGTKFIFQEHEGNMPTHKCVKDINSWYENCTIHCPNCNRIVKYSECTELKSQKDNFAFHQVW